ncbi:unnamed protein product [Arabis nemorensis]|uniref:Retrotransposon gag domain-containing protein n=1 Tax=Arabis nemorensis TaxID=586526 RepID=A0A565C590_9BRAS|nr:unnamed protein product [Arabis nemorensis]
MREIVQAFNGVNIQDQPGRQRVVDVETSSHENRGSSHGSDVNPSIVMEHGKRRRDNRPQQHPRREEDFKVDFPNFEGNLNLDDFLDWLRSMEMAFEYNTYNDEKKFKVMGEVEETMKRRFLSDDYKQDLYLKLTHLQQEKRTLRCDVQEPQERTIVRFVHGLNEDIASKVELQPFWTLDDVKKLAIKVEKQNKAGKKPYTRSYNSGSFFIPKVAVKGEMSYYNSAYKA